MIDPTLVTRKLALIVKDLEALERFGAMSVETYLGDPIHEVAVERYLERTIGRMIDVNYHLLTESGQPPPTDYFPSFVELGKLGAVPDDFSRTIAHAAGLRNRIVHEYDELDERKVFEALRGTLCDIPRYVDHVQRFVEDSGTVD